MKKYLTVILLTMSLVAQAFAQNRQPQSALASNISVIVNGPEVVISWRDSSYSPLSYQVLRLDEYITAKNYRRAKVLATLPPGSRSFTDIPKPGKSWWYAVFTSDDQHAYDIFVKWGNSYPQGISVNPSDAINPRKNTLARVLKLQTLQRNDQIEISYTADRARRNITIFRSASIIDTPDVLDFAIVVGTDSGRHGKIYDKPVPNVVWYYAAVDTELFKSANQLWMNYAALSKPTSVFLDSTQIKPTVLRPAPLPQLRISRSYKDGSPIPEISGKLPIPQSVDKKTERMMKSIVLPIKYNKKIPDPKAHVMEIDLGVSQNRKQQNLQAILDGPFKTAEWEDTESKLFALSASNGLTRSLKLRILYYQGQALYFLGRYRESFASFALASEEYYGKCRPWMLALYARLSKNP